MLAFLYATAITRPCLCFPEQFELVVRSLSADEIGQQLTLSNVPENPLSAKSDKHQFSQQYAYIIRKNCYENL